ncbi:hypothetical protein O9993_08380 [Vibrio lentus]|nr:hypothetical protein [Vibrio lentus]
MSPEATASSTTTAISRRFAGELRYSYRFWKLASVDSCPFDFEYDSTAVKTKLYALVLGEQYQ